MYTKGKKKIEYKLRYWISCSLLQKFPLSRKESGAYYGKKSDGCKFPRHTHAYLSIFFLAPNFKMSSTLVQDEEETDDLSRVDVRSSRNSMPRGLANLKQKQVHKDSVQKKREN